MTRRDKREVLGNTSNILVRINTTQQLSLADSLAYTCKKHDKTPQQSPE
jgi:hypothetical protein